MERIWSVRSVFGMPRFPEWGKARCLQVGGPGILEPVQRDGDGAAVGAGEVGAPTGAPARLPLKRRLGRVGAHPQA